MEMMKISQVAKLAGISVRALHYYDEIGLLEPKYKDDKKYRLYSKKDIEMLWQILFFKEIGFPLSQIKRIVNNPIFDKNEALKNHKKLLLEKRKRLDKIITSIDETLEKGFELHMIDTFNNKNYEKYKVEAIQKYGNTAEKSYERVSKYSKEQWGEIQKEANKIFVGLAENMEKGSSEDIVQGYIGAWKNHITKYYYDCTLEILKGLGELYVKDERFTKNINKTRTDLAIFMKKAIDFYCEKNN